MGVYDYIEANMPRTEDVSSARIMVGHKTKNSSFNSMLSATYECPKIFVKKDHLSIRGNGDCGVSILYKNIHSASIYDWNELKVCKIRCVIDNGSFVDYEMEFCGK